MKAIDNGGNMNASYHGSCLCGVARFEIEEFMPQIAHCHCSMCRRSHSAAFATIAGVSRSKFRWLEGEGALKENTAENGTTRTFCSYCGSSLTFSSPRAPADVVEVAVGAVDDDVPVQPADWEVCSPARLRHAGSSSAAARGAGPD